MTDSSKKFTNYLVTAKGKPRASVRLTNLKTLWINTGTLCNLACRNCYIESSPRNDRLAFISAAEVIAYLDEIKQENYPTEEIAFTGGEPFVNKEIFPILEACLSRGFNVLVLTNAMRPMQRYLDRLLDLYRNYPETLSVRVSVDHYAKQQHEAERGEKSWDPMIAGLKWLSDHNFKLSAAGRTCWDETDQTMRQGYQRLFTEQNIRIAADNPEELMLFPEMDDQNSVPEITTDCWKILDVSPEQIMCSSSRMIVKRKGAEKPAVVACTLLPYEEEFEFAHTLKDSTKTVYLNHQHCAKFCVLGGGACSRSSE